MSSDQLRDLLALGLDLPTVTQIVTIFERDASRDGRDDREMSAARSRRYRLRKSGKAKANDVAIADNTVTPSVTVSSRDAVTECRTLSNLSLSVVKQDGNQEEGLRTEFVDTGKQKVSRGTRITREWWPDESTLKFCSENGLRLFEIDRVVAEFIDYWIALPGHRGTKLDWNATFRNRVRQTCVKNGARHGTVKRQSLGELALDLADEARALEHAAGIGRSPIAVGGN